MYHKIVGLLRALTFRTKLQALCSTVISLHLRANDAILKAREQECETYPPQEYYLYERVSGNPVTMETKKDREKERERESTPVLTATSV